MSARDTYVLIGVDMETDVGSFTPYYEGTIHGTPRLLEMMDRKGIPGTFYFTGECAQAHPEVAAEVVKGGHEIGCNSLQHETLGDELFPLPNVKPVLRHEVAPRVKLATEWVEEATGARPKSFRCPRLWGSTEVVRALAANGYTTDATYPMYFYRQQFEPYFVDLDDWTQPGSSDLLEIPNFADMTMESSDPGLERDRDQWPLFRTKGGQFMLDKVNSYLDFCDARGVGRFITFYIHPWEFHPMQPSYDFGEAIVTPHPFITQSCDSDAVEQMEIIVDGLLGIGAQFVRADQLPDIVRARQ